MSTDPPIPNSHIIPILEELKSYFYSQYSAKIEKIILFGSQARGDARPDSDIDILVILKDSFDYYQENKRNSEFIADLCLRHDIVISCFLMDLQAWFTRSGSFVRNIKKEGLAL